MVFYSQLIGREILDHKGNRIGKLKDFIADFSKKLPTITHLVFRDRDGQMKKLSWKHLESLEKTGIFLNDTKEEIVVLPIEDTDMLLEDVILDQQVVDIDGLKLVRANDIVLDKVDNDFCFTGIDIGIKGITRRLGLSRLNMTLLSNVPQRLIKWENVESMNPTLKNIQLNVPQQKLGEIHPADLADFIETLSHKERAIIFKSLDLDKAADALEETQPDIQKSVVRHLKKDRIAKILENMVPDEAVDLLALFPKEKVSEFLTIMECNKAQVLKNIMNYDSDVAGGIMTTEYFSVPEDFTTDQAIQLLRENSSKFEQIHILYVVDKEHRLVGRVSMKDLLLNKADTKIVNIMKRKYFKVGTEASARDIQHLFKKYNLLSLPVVNKENRLVGIITHDDIFDIVLPRE
jgi:magnesium transporter